MKYIISVDQLALAETDLDLTDAAILDYLQCLAATNSQAVQQQRLADDTGQWTWLDYQQLIRQMPLLRLKAKGSVSNRITKLAEGAFIDTKAHGKRLYFRMGQNWDILTTGGASFPELNDSVQFQERNRSVSGTNNNTIDNNTNINISTNIDIGETPLETESEVTKESHGNETINRMFHAWHEVIGYPISSKQKLNRYACYNLIRSHGEENLLKAINGVALTFEDQFAPRIADFCDLQASWNKLMAWGSKRQHVSASNYQVVVA